VIARYDFSETYRVLDSLIQNQVELILNSRLATVEEEIDNNFLKRRLWGFGPIVLTLTRVILTDNVFDTTPRARPLSHGSCRCGNVGTWKIGCFCVDLQLLLSGTTVQAARQVSTLTRTAPNISPTTCNHHYKPSGAHRRKTPATEASW
jgi:hypothetical protein